MNYIFHNNLIIRTPFKPLKTIFTKEDLLQLFQQKEVQESLFLSSPNLLNEFNLWKKDYKKGVFKEDKLTNSLLKYTMRMHSRCTPFGLFAGCNLNWS